MKRKKIILQVNEYTFRNGIDPFDIITTGNNRSAIVIKKTSSINGEKFISAYPLKTYKYKFQRVLWLWWLKFRIRFSLI